LAHRVRRPRSPVPPAWQEAITGVSAAQTIRVAREFARNAEESGGRSMIIMGAGICQWFHGDATYRAVLALLLLTGSMGRNGGGWAHYVGQEKCRPITGWATMPMVWYIPPLSPVVDAVSRDGHDGEDIGNLFGALDALRIPIEYLAGLFTAGDTGVVEGVLRRLAAMRSYMRDINLGRETQPHIPQSVGMTEEQIYQMYRLLALAKYEEGM
jgi:hypothetical protein